MSLRRLSFAGAVLPMVLWLACGDTFRPVFVPIPNNPPDPKLLAHVVMVNTNGTADFGTTSLIDVSGDSNLGNTIMGKNPVFAALEPNGRLLVANNGDDTLSSYSATTLLVSTQPPSPTTIVLPTGSKPNFLVSTVSGAEYVSNAGHNTVGLISDTNVLVKEVAVGNNPVALAETPDGSKLYAVNQGDGTVTSINTQDLSYSPLSPIVVGTSPQWAVTSGDGRTLFVANQGSDSVTVIDTFTDVVRGTLALDAGAKPNFMIFDKKRIRLYVCEPGAGKVSVWDVSALPPALPVQLASVTVTANPLGIAVLPDGTKFYSVSYTGNIAGSGGSLSASATVQSFDALTFRSLNTVTVGLVPQLATASVRFPVFAVAAADSSKVYVSWYDAGGAAIIKTLDDSYVLTLPAPGSSQNGVPPPPQNPVFLVTALQ